jgi:hypothetical protein
VERQALAAQQRHAVYMASGRYEINGDEPTVEDALEAFEAALIAEPVIDASDPRDREMFELMGVGGRGGNN